MCGIVGLAHNENAKNWSLLKDWFVSALYCDALRGTDGTGVLAVPYSPQEAPIVYKRALPSADFLQLDLTKYILNNIEKFPFVVGHNRAASKGTIRDENTHPFVEDHIYLVHNGTLENLHELESSHAVDSGRLAASFAKRGAKAVLEKLVGSYAIVWYDDKEGTLNFARNSERPLYVGFVKEHKITLFASEGWMVYALAGRECLSVEDLKEVPKGEIWTLNITSDDMKDFTIEPFSIRERPKSQHNCKANDKKVVDIHNKRKGGGGGKTSDQILSELGIKKGTSIIFTPTECRIHNGNKARCNIIGLTYNKDYTEVYGVEAFNVPTDGYDDALSYQGEVQGAREVSGWPMLLVQDAHISKGEMQALPKPNHPVKEDGPVYEDIPFEEDIPDISKFVLGPGGELISPETFDEYTKEGCVMCGANIYPADANSGFITWTEDNRAYCPDCSKQLDTWGCKGTTH